MGRKSRYETHVKPHLDDIREWYEELTEEQIARRLGVSVASFENYKKRYAELTDVLQSGKRSLIDELKESLKKKAKGFYYEETKTSIRNENGKEIKLIEKYKKYAQPDTGAIHLLLKNLDETWRNDDKATIEMKQRKLDMEKEKLENENW